MPKAAVRMRIDSNAIRQLAATLSQIDRKAARKGLKAGVNDATKAVLKDAKALVPRRSGQLRKSLGRKVKTYRGGAVVSGIVGPRKGFRVQHKGRFIDPAKYAHLVEYGRREVVPKKKKVLADKPGGVVFGTRVRSVPPRPFLRPAWEANKARVVDLILAGMRREFAKFLTRRKAKRSR